MPSKAYFISWLSNIHVLSNALGRYSDQIVVASLLHFELTGLCCVKDNMGIEITCDSVVST